MIAEVFCKLNYVRDSVKYIKLLVLFLIAFLLSARPTLANSLAIDMGIHMQTRLFPFQVQRPGLKDNAPAFSEKSGGKGARRCWRDTESDATGCQWVGNRWKEHV